MVATPRAELVKSSGEELHPWVARAHVLRPHSAALRGALVGIWIESTACRTWNSTTIWDIAVTRDGLISFITTLFPNRFVFDRS